jgi:hypothetical protein
LIGDTMIHVYLISNSPEVADFVDTLAALSAFARDDGPL